MIKQSSFVLRGFPQILNTSVITSKITSLYSISSRHLFRLKPKNNQSILSKSSFSFSTQKPSFSPASKAALSQASLIILQKIQSHIESQSFKQKFNSYHYLQKYSWMCLHSWIIMYRLRQTDTILDALKAFFIKRKIQFLIQEYTRDQVYEYDEHFDRDIYEELKRRQEVMNWALDEYFVFNFKQKTLQQIIEEDFGLFSEKSDEFKEKTLFSDINTSDQILQNCKWKKQQNLKLVSKYFLQKIQELQSLSFEKIKSGQIQQWLQIK